MDDEFTTESALLEWATGADADLKQLSARVTFLQHMVFALCIAFFFHAVVCCLYPNNNRRIKRYKH